MRADVSQEEEHGRVIKGPSSSRVLKEDTKPRPPVDAVAVSV